LAWLGDRIAEFEQMDPRSTAFRFAEAERAEHSPSWQSAGGLAGHVKAGHRGIWRIPDLAAAGSDRWEPISTQKFLITTVMHATLLVLGAEPVLEPST
jgi:hypothetical protein